MFLAGQFRPITDTIGVIGCDVATCSREYVAWVRPILEPLGSTLEVEKVHGADLGDMLRQLLPLVRVGTTRTLLVGGPPGWTICLTNGWRGSDVTSIVAMLASRLACDTVRVTYVRDVAGPPRRYGARIVTVRRGEQAVYRSLTVANDGGKWVESQYGSPLAEEEAAWFTAKRVRDRFNEAQLRELMGRLVPGIWEPASWMLESSRLVTRVGVLPPNFTEVSLEEAQGLSPRRG